MSQLNSFTSPADLFLEEEVYRLGTSPGLRSLPPGPSRDFILLSWGPIVYRTCYKPEKKDLIQDFLFFLNDAVRKSLNQTFTGSEDQIKLLTRTYSSKIFSSRSRYEDIDEDAVRHAFHDYKVSLALPVAALPSRLRACLMVDDGVLSHLKAIMDLCDSMDKEVDLDRCWVKVIEENFPDTRFGDRAYVTSVKRSDEVDGGESRKSYRGWTTVSLSALVEVFDGLRQMKSLVEYHRDGRVYLGHGKWSNL